MPRKKKAEQPEEEKKGNDLFSLLNGIFTDQSTEFFDELSEADKKLYKNSRYMLHRFISMNPHYSTVVNEIQKYTNVPERCHYLFLTSLLPKGRQFNKYIKGSKEGKYEEWLVSLVAKHYNVSQTEAIQYLDIYYSSDRVSLKQLCEFYGTDPKVIKKAKL